METNSSRTVTCTTSANHFITAASEFPSYVSRKRSFSAVSTGGGYQYCAYKYDGTINTVYIPNWGSLSNADKKKVFSERKKKGVKLWDWKGSKSGNNIDNLKELEKQNYKFKSKIKLLKKKVTNNNDEGDVNNEPEDSGKTFGGK